MAHFYGSVTGRARNPASRVGTQSTGLQSVAASWEGAVKVTLYVGTDRKNHAKIKLMKWRGAGIDRVLYDGPVDGTAIREPLVIVSSPTEAARRVANPLDPNAQ